MAPVDERAEDLEIVRVTEGRKERCTDKVTRESPLTIYVNKQEVVTLLCSPGDQKHLAVGFLHSEGFLRSREDIGKVTLFPDKGLVWIDIKGDQDFSRELMSKRLVTSGCGRGASFYNAADASACRKVETRLVISPGQVLSLVRKVQEMSLQYRRTGGVHSAALCDAGEVLVFSEDIGRHNAVDKVFGRCLMEEIDTAGRIVVTSGRMSSEIVLKTARRGMPVLLSRSAPTDLAVKLAAKLGVTLVGFIRGKRMNVYANEQRIG